MKEHFRVKGLNRNQLKWIVIAAMLIDHIAWAFVPLASPLGQILHFIGRLTGPTMACFVVEGYCHTHNLKKYMQRMAIFAALSWIPYVYFESGRLPISIHNGKLFFNPTIGVIYTLFLGLVAIYLWDKARCPKWVKILGIIGLCMLSMIGDWMFFDVLWCFFLYIYRDQPKKKWLAFSLVGIGCLVPMLIQTPWWSMFFMVGIYMVPFLVQFVYNGKPGSKHPFHKWFFYLFYPLHLLILGILKWVVFV